MPITSTILIYNSNKFDVKISASNYGLTNRPNWQSDIIAWEDYFSTSSPVEKIIQKNGYDNIFSQSISAIGSGGNVFGIVSRLSVSDLNGNPASVVLFDLAYAVDSSSATECAEAEDYDTTLRYRGLGKGFYETFNLPILNIDDVNNMWGFKFGSLTDSFNGKDLIQMTDSSQKLSPNGLSGNFGVQMSVNMSIKNMGTAGNFAVFYGSNGGPCFPFVCYNGVFGKPTYSMNYGQIGIPNHEKPNGGYYYADILDLGWLESGGEINNISFFTALTAMGAAPLVLGIRRL